MTNQAKAGGRTIKGSSASTTRIVPAGCRGGVCEGGGGGEGVRHRRVDAAVHELAEVMDEKAGRV